LIGVVPFGAGNAKIHQFDQAMVVDDDVGGFYIAVNDAVARFFMCVM